MPHGALVCKLTVAPIVGLLLFDHFFHIRTAHLPTLAGAARWSAAYVGVALLFGGAVFALGGTAKGTEHSAGHLTEKARSIDNVFVFLVNTHTVRVPREDRRLAACLDPDATGADAAARAALHASLLEAEAAVRALPDDLRGPVHERQTLRELLQQAHQRQHDSARSTEQEPWEP